MLQAPVCQLLLALALCCAISSACNLTQTWYDENSGQLHRCLNSTGENEWHLGVACWVRALGDSGSDGRILELAVGKNYSTAGSRTVAECRSRFGRIARVYHVCLDDMVSGRPVRWPGDVWTAANGLKFTCTNPSPPSSMYYDRSSQVILYGCNSTKAGLVIAPGSREQHDQDGIERMCMLSDVKSKGFRYTMEAVGCWLRSRSNQQETVRLAIGQNYSLPAAKGQPPSLLATCVRVRSYDGKLALVYHLCKENGTSGEALHQPGSSWTGSDGIQRECLPASPSQLISARTVVRTCYENATLFAPDSVSRKSDGSIARCVFNRYESAYGWFQTVGCWFREPYWSRLANLRADLPVGKEFCPDDKRCLARCQKHPYREKVALVAKVCFANVGKGVTYRMPHENWTDDDGLSRTCVPMPDQFSNFGVGAEAVHQGCGSRAGNGPVTPGTQIYSRDYIIYECAFSRNLRQYNFDQMAGCWMQGPGGQRARIPAGEAIRLPNGKNLATCRKKSYSNRVTFTLEVCFKSTESSPMSWNSSGIAFPGDILAEGSLSVQCNPAPTHSDGEHAGWIVYGCLSASHILAAPGEKRLFDKGIIMECAHNGRGGALAAYAWVNPVGCWFQDHQNQTVMISKFNVNYTHSAIGKPTARCEKGQFSLPKLVLLVCLSAPNRRFYVQGDKWTDSETRLAKQCVRASRYSTDSVISIDAGCWQQATKAAEAPEPLSRNGSVAYGSSNRVLRCEFDEGDRQYKWKTSIACWHAVNGTEQVLPIGQEVWWNGMLIYKCRNSVANGAMLFQYACNHSGTWHRALTTWQDASYQYTCLPASGDSKAKTEKTHCITDGGQAIQESQKINGVQYICMRICGFLEFRRDPTPQHYQQLRSRISNCHSTNMNIINNIG